MESILSVLSAITTALVVIGGAMAAIFIAHAGILFLMAQGDPQQMAKARSAFFGSVVGILIMGSAFLIPRALSEAVLQPPGAPGINSLYSEYDCDGMLQRQLEIQRFANNEHKVNHIISLVQAKNRFCSADMWNPRAGKHRSGESPAQCLHGRYPTTDRLVNLDRMVLGGLAVPASLRTETSTGKYRLKQAPVVRDGANNLMVVFEEKRSPNDGAICWVYFAQYDVWFSQTPVS